jgi:hypothetical protein
MVYTVAQFSQESASRTRRRANNRHGAVTGNELTGIDEMVKVSALVQ